jgi:hypothetical protein
MYNFLQLCKYYVGATSTKGKIEQMWKHVMNLVVIQWKMCFNTKQEWRLTIKLKILELCRIVFLSCRLWFLIKTFFVMSFLSLAFTYFLLFHCVLHSLKVLHNKWCSDHYVCIMWKQTIEKFSGPERKDVLFSSMFFLCIFLFAQQIIFICVLIIWLNFMHHIITI